MVRKSYGKKRKTRRKLKLKRRPTVNDYLKKFNTGDIVHIDIASSTKIPHPKFQGLSGKVIGKSGRNYIVAVRDGNLLKKLYIAPQHLKK